MPGFYAEGEYDLAGFVIGLVDGAVSSTAERLSRATCSSACRPQASTQTATRWPGVSCSTWRASPSTRCRSWGARLARRCSRRTAAICRLQSLLDRQLVKGLAHITGGGITENLPRILPEGTGAAIARDGWDVPPIFQWLQRTGQVADDEMLRAFNMGVGMIVACEARYQSEVLAMLHASGGADSTVIGSIVAGNRTVEYL